MTDPTATTSKIDYLKGLKENVIIGRLIPAGTGFGVSREEAAEGPNAGEKVEEKKEEAAA